MTRDASDKPLVGEHPYSAAARERKNPSPTADPQVVADLDRLQLAEHEFAAALGVSHDAATVATATSHEARASELRQLIIELGGAPSDREPGELPHEPEQLAANAQALTERYESALKSSAALPSVHAVLERNLAATRTEAAGYGIVGAMPPSSPRPDRPGR